MNTQLGERTAYKVMPLTIEQAAPRFSKLLAPNIHPKDNNMSDYETVKYDTIDALRCGKRSLNFLFSAIKQAGSNRG